MSEHTFGAGTAAGGADPSPLVGEALRLVSSVQDWAQGWAARNVADGDQHTGADCQWCPLCQFVAILRGERPEVADRVAEAGTAIAGALRTLIEGGSTATGSATAHRPPRPRPASRVQKINLADET
jgi:hypothetical protein